MSWTPPEHDARAELRDWAPEASWREAMEAIALRHGLDAREARPFATGSDIVWSLGAAVVKLTAPEWDWQLDAEARWLRQVAGRIALATPAVLARDELGGWPYVVLGRIPGCAVGEVWAQLSGSERRALAAELGGLVRALHELPVEGATKGDRPWASFWQECHQVLRDRDREQGAPAHLVEEIPAFLESVGALPGEASSLLHTELVDQHLFVERREGRYQWSGLIDFADGRIGPREYEFPAIVEFIFRGERGLLAGFLAAYGYRADELSSATSRRLLAWGLCHRYGRLTRMLGAIGGPVPATLSELAERLYSLETRAGDERRTAAD